MTRATIRFEPPPFRAVASTVTAGAIGCAGTKAPDEEMKISLDQPIAVSAEEAQAAYLDPAFYTSLGELSGISAPEVRSFSQSPDHARIVLGYRFSGQLNGPATKSSTRAN